MLIVGGKVKQKIYEGQVKSERKCSAISGVFQEILTAMFKNFPRENGKSVTVNVPMKSKCKHSHSLS